MQNIEWKENQGVLKEIYCSESISCKEKIGKEGIQSCASERSSSDNPHLDLDGEVLDVLVDSDFLAVTKDLARLERGLGRARLVDDALELMIGKGVCERPINAAKAPMSEPPRW